MDAATFLNANPDIRTNFYSWGWQGRSDQDILNEWLRITGERGARYQQAQSIVTSPSYSAPPAGPYRPLPYDIQPGSPVSGSPAISLPGGGLPTTGPYRPLPYDIQPTGATQSAVGGLDPNAPLPANVPGSSWGFTQPATGGLPTGPYRPLPYDITPMPGEGAGQPPDGGLPTGPYRPLPYDIQPGGGYVGIETGPEFFPDGTRNPMYLPQQGNPQLPSYPQPPLPPGGSNQPLPPGSPVVSPSEPAPFGPPTFSGSQPSGTVPTIPGSEPLANPRSFESVLGLTGLSEQEITKLRSYVYGLQQGLSGKPGYQPTLALQNIWGQPKNIAQSLILAGLGEQGAQTYLQQTPLVQRLNQQAQGGVATGPSGFQFPTGRKLPVREMLQGIETNSQQIPLTEGLASFSGQNPASFWGDFSAALPKGGQNALTRLM